jgi:hypothetical protein
LAKNMHNGIFSSRVDPSAPNSRLYLLFLFGGTLADIHLLDNRVVRNRIPCFVLGTPTRERGTSRLRHQKLQNIILVFFYLRHICYRNSF